MGLTFFKGINVGPFRFNLSGSGVGISTGVRGFRIGTGPRGTYISMAAGGFRYRTYLPTNRSVYSVNSPVSSVPSNAPDFHPQALINENHAVQMTAISSADVSTLIDENSSHILDELNTCNSRTSLVTVVNFFAFLLAIALSAIWSQFPDLTAPKVAVFLAFICYLPSVLLAYYADLRRLQTVLMFDADEDFQSYYQAVLNAFQAASNSSEIKHVRAQGIVSAQDRKYHAGATRELDLRKTQIASQLPARVKANTTPACLFAGKDELYFFPDRLLVKSENQFGAVSFESLHLQADTARLIVDTAPSDGRVVGMTWRYVNKKGGPDKRFKNNSELPIVEFSTLVLRSDRGLNELFYFSRPQTAESIKKSVDGLRDEIKKNSSQKPITEIEPSKYLNAIPVNNIDPRPTEPGGTTNTVIPGQTPASTDQTESAETSVTLPAAKIYLGLDGKNFGLYDRAAVEGWIRENQLEVGTVFWDDRTQQWLDISQFPQHTNS